MRIAVGLEPGDSVEQGLAIIEAIRQHVTLLLDTKIELAVYDPDGGGEPPKIHVSGAMIFSDDELRATSDAGHNPWHDGFCSCWRDSDFAIESQLYDSDHLIEVMLEERKRAEAEAKEQAEDEAERYRINCATCDGGGCGDCR